jgi:simple sugar transport system permease protein
MLPYLVTLIVLAFTSKKSRAPKAEGIPYDQGSR